MCRLENRNLNGHPCRMALEQIFQSEWRLFYARPIFGSGFRHQLTGCSADRSCVKHVRHSNDGYRPSSTLHIFCHRKGNKAQGFRSQVSCAGRCRGGSHSIRRDYNIALHVHICRLSGRKPAARSSSFNGETLWCQFLYFGWSTPGQRMAPAENAERKIVDGATNYYRRRARYGGRAESPDDAPAEHQSVETSGTGKGLWTKSPVIPPLDQASASCCWKNSRTSFLLLSAIRILATLAPESPRRWPESSRKANDTRSRGGCAL